MILNDESDINNELNILTHEKLLGIKSIQVESGVCFKAVKLSCFYNSYKSSVSLKDP